jgi:hypothetical protein
MEGSLIRFAATFLVLSFATAAAQPNPGPATARRDPGPATARPNPGLDAARRNYPPLILGGNVRATNGSPPYARACPAAGAGVEQRGGPAIEYLGASPSSPDLCPMRIGSDVVEGWQAIWLTAWPGAEAAAPALKRVIQGRTGEIVGFDVRMAPGSQWHDLIRNEGIEDINLLGTVYHTLKLSHYREGFEGNTYRSVSTVWKDIPTGMILYATYQHIAGRPELDGSLTPAAIVPAP